MTGNLCAAANASFAADNCDAQYLCTRTPTHPSGQHSVTHTIHTHETGETRTHTGGGGGNRHSGGNATAETTRSGTGPRLDAGHTCSDWAVTLVVTRGSGAPAEGTAGPNSAKVNPMPTMTTTTTGTGPAVCIIVAPRSRPGGAVSRSTGHGFRKKLRVSQPQHTQTGSAAPLAATKSTRKKSGTE